ncbi:MAG: folate family ECF transporter S component [Oscillospiraceae bacterium]|nr:folate family ECF transporter S component [Oscillospiraceae bacterium]
MTKVQKSTALYKKPFSRAYWRDAANELKDTKMLVVTALMIAVRIALKPLAIPLGPQLSIQTAMLATALGAMIFGPVVAIPAAVVSDTIGFMIYPTGDYFLPFMLTEIASTMFYALFLYRANVTPLRVMLSRFCICFFVNVVLQQFIYAWWYVYIGNPEEAKESILGIMTLSRILKNICMFPIESVVLTVFLRVLLPVTKRAKLTYGSDAEMKITAKQIVALVLLTAIGICSAIGYLGYRYTNTSRSADYSTEERVEANKAMAQLVLDETDDWDGETVVCIVDSAYRPLFGSETDYTVAVYVLDEDAFAAGQADAAANNKTYDMDTLWGYSKSGPKKDQYQSLVKVASVDVTKNEDTGEILSFDLAYIEAQ